MVQGAYDSEDLIDSWTLTPEDHVRIDETLEMHERFLGKLFNKAQRKHLTSFQEQGKAINDKVRLYALVGQALIEAKQSAG
jgi:hypothetical protein